MCAKFAFLGPHLHCTFKAESYHFKQHDCFPQRVLGIAVCEGCGELLGDPSQNCNSQNGLTINSSSQGTLGIAPSPNSLSNNIFPPTPKKRSGFFMPAKFFHPKVLSGDILAPSYIQQSPFILVGENHWLRMAASPERKQTCSPWQWAVGGWVSSTPLRSSASLPALNTVSQAQGNHKLSLELAGSQYNGPHFCASCSKTVVAMGSFKNQTSSGPTLSLSILILL